LDTPRVSMSEVVTPSDGQRGGILGSLAVEGEALPIG
jgi:hypothetical protein